MMKNPWEKLPKQNNFYVLDADAPFINQFNESLSQNTKELFRIHTEIMPAPYMGDILHSKIVILTLNPGIDTKEAFRDLYEKYKEYWEKQIVHQVPDPNYPLFCFEKKYITYSNYWQIKLNPLIEASSTEKVAKNISIIQFFPYHSLKYKDFPKSILNGYLESQKYNFELVKKAINRNALIVIQRGKSLWFKAIPELEKLEIEKKLYKTNSYLNPIMSENNLHNAFEKIKHILNT